MKKLYSNRGFTLVELIIVIAVIGALAAILIPTFSLVIDRANEKSALSDARNTLTHYMNAEIDVGSLPDKIVIFVNKARCYYIYGYDRTAATETDLTGPVKIRDFNGSVEELIEKYNADSETDPDRLFYVYPDSEIREQALIKYIPDNVKVYEGVLLNKNAEVEATATTPNPQLFSVVFKGKTTNYHSLEDAWSYATSDSLVTSDSNRARIVMLSDAEISAPLLFKSTLLSITTKYVTLDLNGYTIDRGLADSAPVEMGCVIIMEDFTDLIIADTSDEGTGTITGGNSILGGGGISSNGKLTIRGGTITGNRTEESGGGINSGHTGNLYMLGGAVIGNYAGRFGGGIYNANTKLYLSDCIIRNNTAGESAGGVHSSETQLSGNVVVTDNMVNGVSCNFHIHQPVTIRGLLTGKIGITVFNDNIPTAGSPFLICEAGEKTNSSVFVSDNEDYEVEIQDNKVYLVVKGD